MVLVKICGITNLEDALAAVEAGADALGFNFYKRSPRFVDPRTARTVIDELPSTVLSVGVFVNEAKEAIEALAAETGFAAAQLHGDESPDFCASLAPLRVIKALRSRADFDPASAGSFLTDAVLFDSYDPHERGGTGRMNNLDMARRVRTFAAKLYLAGGLTPDNVADAIATVEPYAVDVCSGVERSPGVKDHALMRRFVAAAKA